MTGLFLLAACSPEPETSAPAPAPAPTSPPQAATPAPATAAAARGAMPPARITVERGGFIPEGIEYDQANHRFLTGSLAEGSIFEIHDDGTMTAAVTDPELVSSVGIEVDEPRDRLLVCNSDSAVFQGQSKGQAKLGVYNLTTGERLAMVDLGAVANAPADGAFFCNDVTVTDDGTIFATDTQQNVVYKVDAAYNASLLHKFEPMEGLALNGIVAHPDGYLIVVGGANLYKVPIDNPGMTSQVMIASPVTGADGIFWMADGRLGVVSNSESNVKALTSADDWASAEVDAMGTFEGQATTGAAMGADTYVVEPHFNDQDPPMILKVTLQ
jgi:sugar lactone lactonase YvrE